MPLPLQLCLPVILLFLSNIFMTYAWYGHLKTPEKALPLVILASWGIAFIEYCFVVPANRMGYGLYSAVELKTIQEVLTLIVFSGFAVFYLGEKITYHHIIGFAFIALGAYFIFNAPKS
ncbi:DMT family protein [Kordiimonas pumila]|uniref:DMT family protein n=1 Tax=Kordiimonas pumila TaxID=2161677 RepID=A0ABV7D0D6_9PROT|nr:DMT family protein [Kordiimonas pumila]